MELVQKAQHGMTGAGARQRVRAVCRQPAFRLAGGNAYLRRIQFLRHLLRGQRMPGVRCIRAWFRHHRHSSHHVTYCITPFGYPMSESVRYQKLIESARRIPMSCCAVTHPCEASSLSAAVEAGRLGLFRPILIGPSSKIQSVARDEGIDISGIQIIDTPHSHASAERAVECVQSGQASLLMKGSLHSDELLHAILKHKGGLRTERRLSHV